MRVPAEQIRQQLVSVLRAWGMSDAHADTTAEMMLETDLRGVDSHGISMLPTYDREFRAGRLNMRPQFKTVREGPATALIDADASLGHPVSVYAMNLAIDKCRDARRGRGVGLQLASLRRGRLLFAHRRRSRRDRHGDLGHPRRDDGADLRRGTHHGDQSPGLRGPRRPQRAIPARHGDDDGRGRQGQGPQAESRPVPSGWVVDGDGQPVTDAATAFAHVFEQPDGGITPLGGPRELGGHKGYGLAVMVHILGGTLAGASFSPLRNQTQKPSDPHNIGHFFLAIDPRAFRADGEFEEDLDQVIDVLHNAKRVDPNQPVLVAGDPEMATRAERLRDGVPVPDDLMDQLRAVAKSAEVPFVLAGR